MMMSRDDFEKMNTNALRMQIKSFIASIDEQRNMNDERMRPAIAHLEAMRDVASHASVRLRDRVRVTQRGCE